MKVKAAILALLVFPLFSDVSGYLQLSFFIADFAGDRELLQMARIRLKFDTRILGISTKLHVEEGALSSSSFYLPLLTGSFLDEANPLYFYRGENEKVYLYLDRASLGYEGSRFSFTLGRDRFPWGKARLFSVIDIFNPYEPFALTKEERQGVNGGRTRYYFSGFSWIEAVYVRRKARDVFGGSLFFSLSSFDFQAGAGEYLGKKFVCGALEGDVKGAGVRAEFMKLKDRDLEYTLGFDFQTSSGLYILGEYLRSHGTLFPEVKLFSLSSSYKITPLLKINIIGVYTKPEGKMAIVSIVYSVEENLDVQISLLYSSENSYWALPRIAGPSIKLYF